MRPSLIPLALLALLAAGCAGKGARPCEPVAPEIVALAGQPVYAHCEVDREARPKGQPAVRYIPSSTRMQRCGYSDILLVIGPDGAVLPQTIKVVRSNDRDLSNFHMEAVRAARFEPAMKGGVAVAQIDTLKAGYAVVTSTGTSPPSVSRANAPRC